MKDAILSAAIEVLSLHGLNNWTVEEVASRARCAKGLINYHYRSRQELLLRAAETLRDDRQARRLAALRSSGAPALDRLLGAVVEEVESGRFAAWLALAAADPPLRRAASDPGAGAALAAAAGRSLGWDPPPGAAHVIPSALDGLALRLLQGAPAEEVEEAWHRVWLALVS